jgi:hypothetical protein
MPPRHRLTVDAPRRPADAALLAALRAPEAAASLLDQLYGTYPGMGPWQLTIAADVAVTGPGGRAAGVLDLDIAGERDFACRLCGEVFDVPEREYDIAKDVCRDHYALRVLEARWDAFDVGLPDPTDWGYEPAVRQPDEPRPEKAAAAARYCACIACRAIRAGRCPYHGPPFWALGRKRPEFDVRVALLVYGEPESSDRIVRRARQLAVLDHPAVRRRMDARPITTWAVRLWPGVSDAVAAALCEAGLVPLRPASAESLLVTKRSNGCSAGC